MRRWLLPTLAILVLSLLLPRGAAAKGPVATTFRISAGDLPHPVTVPLTESAITDFGFGQFENAPVPKLPDSTVRYRIDGLSATDPGADVSHWWYVQGSPPAMILIPSGAEAPEWLHPDQPIADLFDRYIELARRNLIGETPTFAEALEASAKHATPRVTIGGQELSAEEIRRFMPLLEQIEPVYYGVQAHMLGGRDLHKVEVRVSFGPHDLTFTYVSRGPIAPYGLLFTPGAVGNWDYIQILDPPGYAQLAYTVPPAFEQLMTERGATGGAPQELVSPRVVPLTQVVREGGIDHIEVWQNSEAHLVEHTSSTDVCAPYPNEAPRPTGAQALNVAVWWKSMEPFPEAVRPAIYSYYSPDASPGARGVLVETQQGAVYSSAPEPLQAPCYAAAEVDNLLRGATGRTSTSSIPIVKNGTGRSAIVAPLLAVGLTLGFLVAWRRPKSRRSQAAR